MAHVVDDLRAIARQVQARVGYLGCSFTAARSDGWIRCSELIEDFDLLHAEILSTAAGQGTNDPQVAASLYVQSYAFRVPSIAIAAYALDLDIPVLDPRWMGVRLTRDRPGEVAITRSTCSPLSVDRLVAGVFDDHLARLIEAVRKRIRVGERLLWGNVASSVASIFRAVQSTGPLGDAQVRLRAEAFNRAAATWLGGLGRYSTLVATDELGWYWHRTSCCLWYQSAGGSYCDDCSLKDPDAVEAQRRADLGAPPSS